MIYQKEKLNLFREIETCLKQYANKPAPIYLDEIYRHVKFNHNLIDYKDVEFNQLLKKHHVKLEQIRARGAGKNLLYPHWKIINRLVLSYKKNPSRQKKTYLKKRFFALVGKLYIAKLQTIARSLVYIPTNKKSAEIEKHYRKQHQDIMSLKINVNPNIDLPETKNTYIEFRKAYQVGTEKYNFKEFTSKINFKKLLWVWLTCNQELKKNIYGKNLLSNFKRRQKKQFSDYFYFKLMKKDCINLAHWGIIKTFDLKRGIDWEYKKGEFWLK